MMGTVNNWDGSSFVDSSTGKFLDVVSPVDGAVIGKVALSSAADVDAAAARAEAAFPEWSSRTTKARAAIMFRFHELLSTHADELADLVSRESGKNRDEALASIAKGNETVEYACSLPQLAQGKIEMVSRGVTCEDRREPLGVVASVVPFNFPVMVPMWTVPIALTMGNCVILKPSEKVPHTMARVAALLKQAGVPRGVFQMVQGTKDVVEALCDHPSVRALTFVGSSPVAQLVAERCHKHHKKVVALGGAKNHLVVLPDADVAAAAQDIVTSFAGACGQRCMAASVLVLVGDHGATADSKETGVLAQVVARASALEAGTGPGQVGAVIDREAKMRILKYINKSVEEDGAECLVDGRAWAHDDFSEARKSGGPGLLQGGTWVGPTVLLHKSANDKAVKEEIFGPVLSVLRVKSCAEALEIENANPFGNAACVYTSNGANASWFSGRFRAGMIGVNVGIPVPREPFSFGGMYGTLSKFGECDITGEGGVDFFTDRRKITTRWPASKVEGKKAGLGLMGSAQLPQAPPAAAEKDVANFNGQM